MPSADFCTAVRDPRGALSPYRTRCRSPGVSLTAFTAHLPNLQPGSAVDTGLRGPVPARPTQTASYSVPVRQVAALLPRFLQTAPRGHRPCASLALCLHQTWAEDLHLRAVKHARHTRAGAQPLENQGFSTAPQARPTLIRSDHDFLRAWILSKALIQKALLFMRLELTHKFCGGAKNRVSRVRVPAPRVFVIPRLPPPGGAPAAHPEEREARRSAGRSPARVSGLIAMTRQAPIWIHESEKSPHR